MGCYKKYIRFRDNRSKELAALEALNSYKSYGYASANEMVIDALLTLSAPHEATLPCSLDELADRISERVIQALSGNTTSTIENAPQTYDAPTIEPCEVISNDVMEGLLSII